MSGDIWDTNNVFDADYLDILNRRATGELPEMESAKSVAEILSEIVCNKDSILDVGCGVGHYYRTYKRVIKVGFSYTGIDVAEECVLSGRSIWEHDPNVEFSVGNIFDLPIGDNSYDIGICTNAMMNLSAIVEPIKELLRVSRKFVVVRTTLSERSWLIQEVFNSAWYAHTDVSPDNEIGDDGAPRLFSRYNIYSKGYFAGLIKRFAPSATVEFIDDTQYSIENINVSAQQEGRPNATTAVGSHLLYGNTIVLPYSFAIITLN